MRQTRGRSNLLYRQSIDNEPEPPQLDAWGRDQEAMRRELRAQLDGVGLDRAEMWFAKSDRKHDPLQYMWMEEWIAEQRTDRRLAQLEATDSRDRSTQRWAIVAAVSAAAAAVIAFLAWMFPRTP